VRWVPPYDLDVTKTPPPYSYKIYRGEGFVGATGTTPIHPGTINTLSFVDAGLNTEDIVYNYVVEAYDANGQQLDKSAQASSVRLEAQSELQRIELNWSAFVPWSNIHPLSPRHLIFRGPKGAKDNQLVLIDSVVVTVQGFTYIDQGQYQNIPLKDDEEYCYRVMTRGSYGNPLIGEGASIPRKPMRNFSQTICAQPSDTIVPCKPVSLATDNAVDCNNIAESSELCNKSVFMNRFVWERPNQGDCQNDIAFYRIYSARSSDADFVFRAQTTNTYYEDGSLPSNAFCYKVSAVDRSGNESELSDPICFDNCPYYELPNIFTPNGDPCNNVFSAYNNRPIPRSEEGGPCTSLPQVFNRWGKEVYTYRSGEERTIYIDWDGRDSDGRELATGIYYYLANVTFITSDPKKRNQQIKGWVHLLR
jgi:hypothetical protein